MVYIFFNDCAGRDSDGRKCKIREFFKNEPISFHDVQTLDDKLSFLEGLTKKDKLVIMGGDGTLNHFVNGIDEREWNFPIYCYGAGTGNDFLNDIECAEGIVRINEYIRNLPRLRVKGESYKFLNGVGFGIDGYCCEVGNEKKHCGKSPNYTTIAIGGLLGKYKTRKARVTVDGVSYEYDNVWLATTMKGRYFGGGMMLTPMQDRLCEDESLTLAVVSVKSRLRILTIFPRIFKGTHVKYKQYVTFLKGKNIEVEFDKPIALQIDGETVKDVKSYSAEVYQMEKEKINI